MKRKRAFTFLVLATLFAPKLIFAQTKTDHASDFSFHGFGFFVQSISEKDTSRFELRHLWLVFDKKLNDDISLSITLAPKGPPKLVHNFQLTWLSPIKGLNYLKFGRFIPAFGWEFWNYRVDRVPTVEYTRLVKPMVARSNGIEVGSSFNTSFNTVIEWKLGAFSGERVGGNIPEFYDGKWDVYPRLRLNPFGNSLWVGGSMRLGPVKAYGVDLQTIIPHLPFKVETEIVNTQGTTQKSVLVVYQVSTMVHGVFRYENIEDGNVIIPGFTVKLPYDNDIKLNAVVPFPDKKDKKVLLEIVLRW